jgi:hypothetical protein
MLEGAAKSLPLLEQALVIEPTYALAHGFAAWAHETIFMRGGMHPENYEKSLRRAHAAIEHGPGEAMVLALAGFTIGMMEHDRKLADQVFERALALSASCAFVYSFGCAPVAYGGDAGRAIDWGVRAIRFSPLDAMNYIPQGVIGFGNFLLDRHEGAVAAGRRAVRLNAGFSIFVRVALGAAREARRARRSKSRWRAAIGA